MRPEHLRRPLGSSPHDRLADLHDAAARWVAPDRTATAAPAWAENVVPLRRDPPGPVRPAPEIAAAMRAAAPVGAPHRGLRFAALLAASFAMHAAWLQAQLWEEPVPTASIGEVSISVELVLGGREHAGPVPERGDAEANSVAAAAQEPDPTPPPTDLAQAEPIQEIMPEPPAMPAAVVPTEPVAPESVASQPVAPPPVAAEPVAPESVAEAVPPARERKPHEEKRRAERREPTAVKRRDAPVAAVAARAAGGAGRGRSDADSNYLGRVSAHLARHQRFPAEARRRGANGTATVAFAFDAHGRVTAAALRRSSGVASLDEEATAMVRRASPFPPPPDGGGRSFTVPVHFKFEGATSR